MVRQPKGKKHIRMIRRRMMRLWKSINFEKGMRDDCLKEILKRHREKVAEEIKKNRKKVAEDSKSQQGNLYLTSQCDNNGWVG